MPLVKKSNKVIKWPVTVRIPQDGGSFEEETYTAHFNYLGYEEVAEISQKGDKELSLKTVIGWDDMNDMEGNPLSFSKKELQNWCDDIHFVRATAKAYVAMYELAEEKN